MGYRIIASVDIAVTPITVKLASRSAFLCLGRMEAIARAAEAPADRHRAAGERAERVPELEGASDQDSAHDREGHGRDHEPDRPPAQAPALA
jgi:hypothetical protein